jgi:hypothetical protein
LFGDFGKESPMSRRKHLAARAPSGRIARHSELASPTAIRRLTDAATAGLRDASWGTTLGRLYLTEKISAGEYALRLAGRNAESAVEATCILDQACTGFDELRALRDGLSALSALFASKRMR